MSADGGTGFVAPAYQDRSLGDVMPAVAAALGIDVGLPTTSLRFPKGQRYVVFLVDGLGLELLREHPEHAPYLNSLLADQPLTGGPVTAGVPSTTATSLTSFGTALPPGAHGLVGYTTRIPGTDRLLNALQWDERVDPREWQPHPTTFTRLAAAGVQMTVVNKRNFAGSGLTMAGQRGAEYLPADKPGERLAAVLEVSRAAPSVTYMYDGDLDWMGHRYGVASSQWEQQLSMIDAGVERLRETLPADVRVVVVADHGMVDSPPTARLDVDEHPDLLNGVALLGGEARFRHVYCQAGAVEEVAAAWREMVGDRAEVLLRDDALSRGWFGPTTPVVLPRLGDVMVASKDRFAVVSSTGFPHEAKLVGLHGSLTSAEMLIPVLVA